MKKLYTLLLTLSLGTVSSYAATKTVKHTIKSGETLYSIAHKNHTTIDEVRAANNLKKGETLKLGTVLAVPQNTYFPDKKIVKHTIKSGETLFTIARKHKTSVDKVRESNGLKLDDTLKVGKVLTIAENTYFPTEGKKQAPKPSKIAKHTIKSGETLFTIARKYGSSVKDVREKNGLKLNDTLALGKVLLVPKNSYTADKKRSKIAKHTIKRGETLFTIARKYGSSVKDVREKNGLKLNDTLVLGRVLEVPKNTYSPESTKIAKNQKKITKTKRSKKYAKKAKKKKSHIRKRAKEQKLARTLRKVKTRRATKKHNSFSFDNIFFSRNSSAKSKKITRLAKQKLGKRYVWGAIGTKNTFDCSGFTSYVCKKNGISIPRTSRAQSSYGKYVSRSNLRPGDLIFFDTSKRRKGYVNHVGIYLGNDRFIHASSAKKKVVISKLGKSFYSRRYKGARRVTS